MSTTGGAKIEYPAEKLEVLVVPALSLQTAERSKATNIYLEVSNSMEPGVKLLMHYTKAQLQYLAADYKVSILSKTKRQIAEEIYTIQLEKSERAFGIISGRIKT